MFDGHTCCLILPSIVYHSNNETSGLVCGASTYMLVQSSATNMGSDLSTYHCTGLQPLAVVVIVHVITYRRGLDCIQY